MAKKKEKEISTELLKAMAAIRPPKCLNHKRRHAVAYCMVEEVDFKGHLCGECFARLNSGEWQKARDRLAYEAWAIRKGAA